MSESDRELLKLAAKAAGIRLHVWGTPGEENFADLGTGKRWNPLTDDGDALRLAVKCRITDLAEAVGRLVLAEGEQTDIFAATRRAIVRAAASIGEQLCRT